MRKVINRYKWLLLSFVLGLTLVLIILNKNRPVTPLEKIVRFVDKKRIEMVEEEIKKKKKASSIKEEQIKELDIKLGSIKREKQLLANTDRTYSLKELSKMWKELGY